LPIHYYRTALQGKKINWKDGAAAPLVRFNFLTTTEQAFSNLRSVTTRPIWASTGAQGMRREMAPLKAEMRARNSVVAR
jgi:hypothetical protein